MKRPVALLLALASLPSLAAAQDTISAERPGFSSSPMALGYGRWQIEGGYQYTRADSGVDGHTLPLLLLRYGAGERTEVQFGWAGYNRIDAGPADIDGVSDASLGIKWQLTDEGEALGLGVFAGLSLPVGSDEFTSDEVDPSVGLFWTWSGRLDFFGTVLISEADSDTSIGNAVGISLPMGDACANCGAYIEYFGIHPEDGGPQHNLNGGITFLRSADLQLDIHAGIGLNDRAADGFIGLGAAYRF